MGRILVINPGSTSTKLAVYEEDKKVLEESIAHEKEDVDQFASVFEQLEYRYNMILEWLKKNQVRTDSLDAIAARGGMLHPVEGGTYEVNEKMIADLQGAKYGEHASNLGAPLAEKLADKKKGTICLIADPTCTDELCDYARMTGSALVENISKYHALSQKSIARKTAESLGKTYESCNLIVAHMGGGITIGVHKCGKVVQVNNGLDGNGPFSPERAGTIPRTQLIELCYSGKYTKEELKKLLNHKGGMVSYLNTNNMQSIEAAVTAGDEKSRRYLEGMCYQIGREIGAGAAVLKGKCDAIILTGGIAYSYMVVDFIRDMVSFIAPVIVEPGSDENRALAEAAIRVLSGKEQMKQYQ